MLLLCCRLDGCWQLLRRHLRTLHRCASRGSPVRFVQHLLCIWAVLSCSQCPGDWRCPHQQHPLCLQTAALLCRQQSPHLRRHLMRPLRQHQLLPACLTHAALGRAWPSCRRLRPASGSLHQELWPRPLQQCEERQLHLRAQRCCLWRRPLKVSASWFEPFTHPCQPSRRASSAAWWCSA